MYNETYQGHRLPKPCTAEHLRRQQNTQLPPLDIRQVRASRVGNKLASFLKLQHQSYTRLVAARKTVERTTYSTGRQTEVRPKFRMRTIGAYYCRGFQFEDIPRIVRPVTSRVALGSTRSWVVRRWERFGEVNLTGAIGLSTNQKRHLQRR